MIGKIPRRQPCATGLRRLASLVCAVATRKIHATPPTAFDKKTVTDTVHRFEESIAGRAYLIEVAAGRHGSLARLYRARARRSHRADAVLRAHAGRGGASAERVADARARARGSALDLTPATARPVSGIGYN